MDQSQSSSSATSASIPPAARASERPAANIAELSLVTGHLALARGEEAPIPGVWQSALDQLGEALCLDARWVAEDKQSTLFQRARRAVNASSAPAAPVFAPWRVVSPTAFQFGQTGLPLAGAQWVASYLFDFGPACSNSQTPVDIALMSPCPEACIADDAQIGPVPRMAVLADMVRAAASEGRTRLAIVTNEAARASIASRLLAFDPSLNDASLGVEFLSVEETVIAIQQGAFDRDAVIAMPGHRGIFFAMLAEATGIRGPWPMLWFDNGLRLVTCESLTGASISQPLDATALIQSLALTASHAGRHYAAKRLYESWAAIRDSGVVTQARSSSAPYVNEIDEGAFMDQATGDRAANSRPLPEWKSIAYEESAERKAAKPVQLTLVT
jgi:hypothetical protein